MSQARRRDQVRGWLRRQGSAALAALPHTLLVEWPMELGMVALAVGGRYFAPGPVGEAIAFAAAAALVIDLVREFTDRVASAQDRELATGTVAGAATSVLDSQIQFTESGVFPMTVAMPDLTLRAIARGEHIFVKLHDPAVAIDRVRTRLFENRQLYAATAGTQVGLLDERARRIAVDAQRELDGAIIALDRLREKLWRHGVLNSSSAKGKALEAYKAADLAPTSDRFHALAASAAGLLAWLERPRGQAPHRLEPESDTHVADRESAASALLAQAVEDVVGDIGPFANWKQDSSLAAVDVRRLDDIAAVEDLVFTGQAIGNGWEALHTVAVQGKRKVEDVTNMVEADLPAQDLNAARLLVEELQRTGQAAFDTGDGERSANNAHNTQMRPDQIKAADDVYTKRRHEFRDALRDTLDTARAILARRPSAL